MAELAGVAARRPASRWALRAMYAVLVVATLALLLLVVGEIVYSFEDPDEHETHGHGLYGRLFDAAFFVFLPTAFFTLVAGLAGFAVGWVRGAQSFRTYGVRALAFVVTAVAVIVIEEGVL